MLLGACGLMALIVFKTVYSFTAKNGYLGYEAQKKYLNQTTEGESALKLLMAGRMELFCCLGACIDRPIFGFGPKAEDTDGYVPRYLAKYGAEEDYITYMNRIENMARQGLYVYRPLPVHSFIAMFWVYYGIVGLIIWMYVLWLIFNYFRQYASAVPQWYGYISLFSPFVVWDIFFSPYGGRLSVPMLIVCILYARAIYERKLLLPLCMELEARKYE